MGWVLTARGLSSSQFRPHLPAGNQISGRRRTGLVPYALASPSGDTSPGKVKGSGRQRRRPTAADVRLAIGVDEHPQMDGGIPSSPPASSSTSSSSSRLMDFLATTPIGQPESLAERTLRQFGEWLAERTEGKAGDALLNLMVLCLSVLPVWILLLLFASGIIKLPFSLPAIEDLIL
uniref:Chlororespiratory reduction 3 n=1 Tax=Goodyera fumata TaxID=1390594 RepID=A0A0F7GZF8_9ASPA